MKIDLRDLLGLVPAMNVPASRVGWPDGPTMVEVGDPDRFSASLDAAMRAFRELRPGTQTLVRADVHGYRNEVWIRVLQNGPFSDRNGQVEASLSRSFGSLRAAAERNGGGLHYWGGNNYLDVSLPCPGSDREEFLE